MEVIFRLHGAEFEWDEHKARINTDKRCARVPHSHHFGPPGDARGEEAL